MILDNIKDLIKDMETILMKDNRFKEEAHFKNMVKTIYNCDSNKLRTIYSMPSYDITPMVLTRITELGKAHIGSSIKTELGKPIIDSSKKETDTYKHDCDEVIEDLKKLIKELIKRVKEAEAAAVPIGTSKIDPAILAQIEALEKEGKFKEALALLQRIV